MALCVSKRASLHQNKLYKLAFIGSTRQLKTFCVNKSKVGEDGGTDVKDGWREREREGQVKGIREREEHEDAGRQKQCQH